MPVSLKTRPSATAVQNACKLCAPLGASLAFRGVEGCATILHGSQGCATYIRRYLIGHFREPMDIASSSFHEDAAVFGGRENLHRALRNVIAQYAPRVIGVASTCLAETIGEDLPMLLHQFRKENADGPLPEILHVNTPSYRGSHAEGYDKTVRALAEKFAVDAPAAGERPLVNLLPGIVSPADLRHLRELAGDFGLDAVLLPDYSDTLDAPARAEYDPVPEGGTPLAVIARMGGARVSLTLGDCAPEAHRAGHYLAERFGVPERRIGAPIGIAASDRLTEALAEAASRPVPEAIRAERGRLVDSYVDGHKYIYGKRVCVYGEEDLVVGLAAFLAETGAQPALCASGGRSGRLRPALEERLPGRADAIRVLEGVDFVDIEAECREEGIELLLGNSKGYPLATRLGIPLVRIGLPVHDRLGAQRLQCLGYRGTQQLYDRILNALLAKMQQDNPNGYLTW